MTLKSAKRRSVDSRRKYVFSGIDHVSSVAFPWNSSFTSRLGSQRTARIFGLSGLSVMQQAATLLAICDRSIMLTANITFDSSTLGLNNIVWDSAWPLVPEAGKLWLDTEAVSVGRDGGDVFVASEEKPPAIYRVGPTDTWAARSTLTAKNVADVPIDIQERNRGIESLSVLESVVSPTLPAVICPEGPVNGDDFNVRRLIEMDAATGDVVFQGVVIMPEAPIPLYVSELVQLDGVGGLSSGAQILLLLRGYTPEYGNLILLYLVDTAGADNIAGCEALGVNSNASSPGCSLATVRTAKAVSLLEWTKDKPLDGQYVVDNYEGMAVVPPDLLGVTSSDTLGGFMMLLVNDNNDNPDQGQPGFNGRTQFVSFRVRFGGQEVLP